MTEFKLKSFSFNLKIQLIANNLYFEFKFKKRTVYIYWESERENKEEAAGGNC